MPKSRATGPFEVKMQPEPLGEIAAKTGLGRMSIDKTYEGDLVATSRGEMLAYRSSVKGSAGYVAMETVTGSLEGRTGSFVLQHSSIMTRGVPEQSITVVPDSGTGELQGINGRMTIIIVDGKHSYQLDYQLADPS